LTLTVISWNTVDGRIERLGNHLSRPLSAQAWPVGIVIHEGYLLRRFIRDIEIILLQGHLEIWEKKLSLNYLIKDEV
jgi:hypothetical protein